MILTLHIDRLIKSPAFAYLALMKGERLIHHIMHLFSLRTWDQGSAAQKMPDSKTRAMRREVNRKLAAEVTGHETEVFNIFHSELFERYIIPREKPAYILPAGRFSYKLSKATKESKVYKDRDGEISHIETIKHKVSDAIDASGQRVKINKGHYIAYSEEGKELYAISPRYIRPATEKDRGDSEYIDIRGYNPLWEYGYVHNYTLSIYQVKYAESLSSKKGKGTRQQYTHTTASDTLQYVKMKLWLLVRDHSPLLRDVSILRSYLCSCAYHHFIDSLPKIVGHASETTPTGKEDRLTLERKTFRIYNLETLDDLAEIVESDYETGLYQVSTLTE